MSRTVLGVLLALLIVAVLLALWALIARNGDDVASVATTTESAASPTPLPIPTSTPVPPTVQAQTAPPTPTPLPTAVPDGFEACGSERSPLRSATYIVDTLSTPLNQRKAPAVDGELMGAFDPGQRGLVFTGDCVVNLADGYVWWEINNGAADVWVASRFVTAN